MHGPAAHTPIAFVINFSFFFQVAGLLDLCVCLLIAEKQFATHKMYTKHINKTYTSYKTSALCWSSHFTILGAESDEVIIQNC